MSAEAKKKQTNNETLQISFDLNFMGWINSFIHCRHNGGKLFHIWLKFIQMAPQVKRNRSSSLTLQFTLDHIWVEEEKESDSSNSFSPLVL